MGPTEEYTHTKHCGRMNLQILQDVRTLDCKQYCDKLMDAVLISVLVLHLIAQMQLLLSTSQESVIIRLTSFLPVPTYVLKKRFLCPSWCFVQHNMYPSIWEILILRWILRKTPSGFLSNSCQGTHGLTYMKSCARLQIWWVKTWKGKTGQR